MNQILLFLTLLLVVQLSSEFRHLQQQDMETILIDLNDVEFSGPSETPVAVEESPVVLTTTEAINNDLNEASSSSETGVVAQGTTTETIETNPLEEGLISIPVVLIPQEPNEELITEESASPTEVISTEVIGTTTVTEVGTPPPTETVIINVGEEENIIIEVENNQELIIIPREENAELTSLSEETGVIATWWSIENEETAFENWNDLQNFIEAEFGANVETAIDTSAIELPVDLETIVEAAAEAQPVFETFTETEVSIIELEVVVGTEVQVVQEAEVTVETVVEATVETVVVAATPETETTVTAIGTIGHTVSVGGVHPSVISVPNPDCKQVQTCQIIRVPGVGNKKVCKTQLLCS